MPERRGFFKTLKAYFDRNRLGELLVVRKYLSPSQLRHALALQKTDHRPLGRILVEEGLVTSRQLRSTIALQVAFRSVATAATLFVSAYTFDVRPSSAGTLSELPAELTSIGSTPVSSGIGAYPGLFGTGEKKSGDLSAFVKWSAMFDRFDRDANSTQGSRVLARWKAELETMRGLPLDAMLERVNDMANKVRYIGDNKNWGKSDYWETPVEFFTNGGDCEDFAITKYVSLRALGVPDSRMRVAIVKDMEKGIPHAILIVYADSGTYILDNQIKSVRSMGSIDHYKPIFSINRSAWWLHTAPRGGTLVASAAGR